jgi:hypothetical protein
MRVELGQRPRGGMIKQLDFMDIDVAFENFTKLNEG